MGIISGIGGAVDGIDTVRNWQITSEAALQAFVASNTKGATGQKAGNLDWNGRYGAYGHTPVRMPGVEFSFTGDMSNGKGARADAIVDEVEIVVDIESGAIIAHTVSFSGNEAVTKGSAATSDATVPFPPTSIGCKVTRAVPASSPSYIELADVRGWTLRLRCDNQAYVNSGTAGSTKRKKGNLSGEVIIPVHADDFSELPQENEVRFLRLYVDATKYWEIVAVMFGSMSDAVVDLEAGAIVGASMNAAITGYYAINSAGVEGSIKTPAAATYWPF